MRSRLLLMIIVILPLSYCMAQNGKYVVRDNASPCLNVRTDHVTTATSIDCLPPGTEVTVVDSAPFWREILFGNNQRGWVAKKYIEPLPDAVPPGPETNGIPENAFLTINFVDVGQGDAIWIQTFDDGIDGNGKFEGYSIVIDGGPYSSDNSNPLLPYMESRGYHNADIEALIITHPHDDHYSGAETISRHFQVNHYYDPNYPSQVSGYKAFLAAMKGSPGHPGRAKYVHLGKSQFGSLNWGSELKAEILYSWDGDHDNTLGSGNTEVNNASIVLRIEYGEHVFLFMGDAEGKDRDEDATQAHYVEDILLRNNPGKLKATVLKIAHHGSETSSTIPFIHAVNPDIVVVQSGRKSFSGTFLPDMTTLQRYCDNNPDVKIYRTDQGDEQAHYTGHAAADGDNVVIRSNGKGKPQVTALQGGQPFNGNFCHH